MPKYLFLVCLFVIVGSSWMAAQIAIPVPPEKDEKWEVSAFFGMSQVGDRSLFTPIEGGDSKTVGLSYDPGHALGLRVTENLGLKIAAELGYSYSDQSLSFTNLSDALPTLNVTQRIHKIVYSFLFYPMGRKGKFQPFAAVGVGTSYFQISDDLEAVQTGINFRDRWKLAASFGGGMKIPLDDRWGVRVDVRDQITSVPGFGLPKAAPTLQDAVGPGLRPEGLFHNWQVDAGIIYRFNP